MYKILYIYRFAKELDLVDLSNQPNELEFFYQIGEK